MFFVELTDTLLQQQYRALPFNRTVLVNPDEPHQNKDYDLQVYQLAAQHRRLARMKT